MMVVLECSVKKRLDKRREKLARKSHTNNSSKSSRGASNKPNQQATTQKVSNIAPAQPTPQPSQNVDLDKAQLHAARTNNKIATIALIVAILSFLSGIGAFGFFNQRQQSQQSQLDSFKTQIAIEHDYSLAHLEFQSLDLRNEVLSPGSIGLGRGMRITNLGPATANNISISATIIYVNKIWGNALHNADQIEISTSNPALVSSIGRTVTTLDGAESINGDNTITINLKPLAQNQSIDIHFNLPTSNTQEGSSANVTLYSKYQYESLAKASDNDVLLSGLNITQAYFDKFLEDAELYASVSCACVGANSQSIQPLIIAVNTSYSFISIDPNNPNTMRRNSSYFQFNFQVNDSYSPPPGSKPINIPSPLYLLAGEATSIPPQPPIDTYIPLHTAIIWPDVNSYPCKQSKCLQLLGV